MPDYPRLKGGDISLNIAAATMPHVQGDIARAPFQSGIFEEVYFEKVPYHAFTGRNVRAIKEAARILRPGGRLVIETGRLVSIAQARAAMREAGFRYVKDSLIGKVGEGYIRITGRLPR